MNKVFKKIFIAALLLAILMAGLVHPKVFSNNQKAPSIKVSYRLFGPSGQPASSAGPRIPSGWTLEPAGVQIPTASQPDNVVLSPDGQNVYVPTSGQWDEYLQSVSTFDLATNNLSSAISSSPAASAFEGVAQDNSSDVFLAGGGRNKIFVYKQLGSNTLEAPANSTSIIPPLAQPAGIADPGYPTNMIYNNGYLYVTNSLPLSQSEIGSFDPTAGLCPSNSDVIGHTSISPNPSSCSVVSVVNVTDPSNLNPPINLIPVGQDAYSIALNKSAKVLYVTNWADDSNVSRANGFGTVSIISLNSQGSGGAEVEAVPVGKQPMGLALSPNGNELVVANSKSSTLTIIKLNSNGMPSSFYNVPVGLQSLGVNGSWPTAVSFSNNGNYIFVTLFGLNAVEVLNADGSPIPQTIKVSVNSGAQTTLAVPLAFIPVGWMPIAITSQMMNSKQWIYVANFQGQGTGPGFYDPASSSYGYSQYTEGSVSAIALEPNDPSQFAFDTAQTLQADDLLPFFDTQVKSAQTDPCTQVQDATGTYYSPLLCDLFTKNVSPADVHVVILLRENKTVDSTLGYLSGSLTSANTDENFETYGPQDTPNLAEIAKTYGINDNNWVAGDESGTGHLTLTGGDTNPWTELFVHVNNDFNLRGNRSGDPLNSDAYARLADQVLNAGYSERTYGGDLNSNSPALANEIPEAIWGNTASPVFSGTNTDYPDTQRASIFISGQATDYGWDQYHNPLPPPEFGKTVGLCGGPSGYCNYPGSSPSDYSKYSLTSSESAYNSCIKNGGNELSCQSVMPNFSILELPDDHTDVFNSGNNPLMWAPQSMVANNDYATGEIVQALSQSPFWKYTLVMIVEDDTQFTADHVNILRSYIVTAGGLAKDLGPANEVSHQVSSFCGIDKTVEDIFALKPISVCDATAMPIDSILANSIPVTNPPAYKALTPITPYLLSYPGPSSVRLKPWCATDTPTEIGFQGLLHFQTQECLASEINYLAKTLKLP